MKTPKGSLVLGGADLQLLLDAYRSGHPPTHAPGPAGVVPRPVLLLSACLLGHKVTYRGLSCAPPTHRRTPLGFLVDCLWRRYRLVDCVPVCPEVDVLAMRSPRPPLRLVRGADGGRRLVSPQLSDSSDETMLRERLHRRHPRLAEELLERRLAGIDGCVLKSRSPSCGVGDARMYADESGSSYEKVDGFFVEDWLRPAAAESSSSSHVVSMPLTTERQLCFTDESRGVHPSRKYAVLSFIADVLARFESKRDG